METLNEANAGHLLAPSLESFHKQSLQWISEVELWKVELNFFQQLLDQNAPKITSPKDKKKLSHLQHLITYYNGELLDEFRQKVRRHKKHLTNRLLIDDRLNVSSYVKRHGTILSHLDAFRLEFNRHKKELFHFLSHIIRQ